MEKEQKKYLLKILISVVLIFTLFPINYLLYGFGIDFFSNKILIPIIFVYLFVICYFYEKKFGLRILKEKTIENIDSLRVSLNIVRFILIGLALFLWCVIIFILLVSIYAFYFIFESFGSAELDNLIYLSQMLVFCSFICGFFAGFRYYYQSTVYKSLSKK